MENIGDYRITQIGWVCNKCSKFKPNNKRDNTKCKLGKHIYIFGSRTIAFINSKDMIFPQAKSSSKRRKK